MRILFVSRFGESFGVAMKCAAEGHEVLFHIIEPKYRGIGKGFSNPRRVNSLNESADLIVFDTSGVGKLADKLRATGKKVIGASAFADKIEEDRAFAQQLMKQYTSAKIPMYQEFHSIKDGLKFLDTMDKPCCFKPDKMPTEWTFVPPDDDENNEATRSMMEAFPHQKHDFILQEKVPGIEISTEGWFDGQDFVPESFNHTIEKKRFMEGDKGRNVGCMGNILWAAQKDDELVDVLLKPLVPVLRKAGHVGPVDVNAKVTEDDVYFLEFTPRFGYDSAVTWLSMFEGQTGDWLYNLGRGFQPPVDYGIGVRLTLSPYPYSEDISDAAAHLRGLKPVMYGENLWPMDVQVEKGELSLAGTSAIIGVVVARGDNPDTARYRVYREVQRERKSDDIQYRADIGEKDGESIERLRQWGWI